MRDYEKMFFFFFFYLFLRVSVFGDSKSEVMKIGGG